MVLDAITHEDADVQSYAMEVAYVIQLSRD